MDSQDGLKTYPKINCKGAKIYGDSNQINNGPFVSARVAKQSTINYKLIDGDYLNSQED